MKKKEYISLVALSLISIVPIFFSGGRGDEVMAIVCTLGVLFFASVKFEIGTAVAKQERTILFMFVLWALCNTFFFSVRPYASFVAFIPFVVGYGLYVALSSYKISDRFKRAFAITLTGGTLISLLWGLYGYLSPDFTLLRLSATFYQPNVFAGFLIIPIMAALWFALFGGRVRLWASIASVVLFTGLFLTFSRGGIISVFFALSVFLVFLIRESFSQKKVLLLRLGSLVLIIIVAAGSAYGLYYLKFFNQSLALAEPTTISLHVPFSVERPEVGESGLGYRVEGIRLVRTLMQERPFTGFGLDTFGQEVSRVITNPAYWGSDPHNLYLRICMELGVLGGLLFVVFVVLIVCKQGKYLFLHKEDMLGATYFSGFLGVLLHNAVDIDFTFSANVILFFIVAGFLSISQEQKERQAFVFSGLFFGTALILIPVVCIYAGTYHLTLAQDALKEKKIYTYEQRFERALTWDAVSPEIKLYGASVALSQGDAKKALPLLLEAKKIHPQDATVYFFLGRAYQLLGNNTDAEQALRKSIALAPYRGLEVEVYLLGVLRAQGKITEGKEVARAGLARFPDSLFESALWTDYEGKSMVKFQKMLLESFLFEFQEVK